MKANGSRKERFTGQIRERARTKPWPIAGSTCIQAQRSSASEQWRDSDQLRRQSDRLWQQPFPHRNATRCRRDRRISSAAVIGSAAQQTSPRHQPLTICKAQVITANEKAELLKPISTLPQPAVPLAVSAPLM